jgi:hypothetical protein
MKRDVFAEFWQSNNIEMVIKQSTRYYNFGSSEDDTEKTKMKTMLILPYNVTDIV